MRHEVHQVPLRQDETSPVEAGDFDRRRREALVRLGALAGCAVPVTVATLSMKANASSIGPVEAPPLD